MPKNLDPQSAALAVVPRVLALVGGQDLDDEDLESFQDVLERHIEGTELRVNHDVEGFRLMAGIRCPFYAHESLAKHAGLAASLQRNGDRMLAHGVVGESGHLSVRFSPRFRDLLTREDNEQGTAWVRWLKGQPVESSAALNSSPDLNDLDSLYPGVDEMFKSWVTSIEPAVRFGLKVLPEAKIRSVLSKVGALFEEPMKRRLAELRCDLIATVQDHLDGALIQEILSGPQIKTVGLYNFITRSPEPGVDRAIADRNRRQALVGYKNLVPVLQDFHSGGPPHARLRTAIDRGEKIQDILVGLTQPDGQTAIKSFLKANLEDLGGGLREININWVRDYVKALSQFPVQRYPKTATELVIASEMSQSAKDVAEIAERTGQAPVDLWEGALKQGWEAAIKPLAGVLVEDLPDDIRATAGLAVGGMRTLRDMVQTVHDTFLALTRNDQERADRLTKVLLGGRGIGRLLENVREYRALELKANEVKIPKIDELPDGAEWFPLLANPEIQIDGVRFVEMKNSLELTDEGQEMRHCVATYASNCKQNGYRIFRSRWTDADGTEHKGTLSIVINEDCMGHHLNQFRSISNGPVHAVLQQASNRLRAGLDDGTIKADFDGYRRDRERVGRYRNHEQQVATALKARTECFSDGLSVLMPPACAGMTLSDFTASDYAAKEIDNLLGREAAKEAIAEMAKVKASVGTAPVAQFGFG